MLPPIMFVRYMCINILYIICHSFQGTKGPKAYGALGLISERVKNKRDYSFFLLSNNLF